MFETPLNLKTVSLKLKRIELCDLLLACTVLADQQKENGESSQRWNNLHEKLKTILDDFDKKQGY